MCLGVPAKIVEVGDDVHFQLAYAEVSGVKRAVNISMVCEGDPSELLDVGAYSCWICHEYS